MKGFIICTPPKHYQTEKIKEAEVGVACKMLGREFFAGSWWGNLKKKNELLTNMVAYR